MDVTVEVVNDTTHECTLDDDATYADCLRAVGLSAHEATVLVDGRPVPDDAPVATDHVQVLRLVQGGCGPERNAYRPAPAHLPRERPSGDPRRRARRPAGPRRRLPRGRPHRGAPR